MSCVKEIAEIAAKEIQGFGEMVGAWLLSHLLPKSCCDGKQARLVLLVDGGVQI